ncbi:MAG TPA: uracil-DNA glycosylase [Deinococcales bacterium]|nr:uracil-DNA glycosylase [Deinococcales bacterium]
MPDRSEWLDSPRSFREPLAVAARLARLEEPHVKPLTDYVLDLRQRVNDPEGVPFFDPADGGIHARVLFLLEAPGPKASASGVKRGSGLISSNNDDMTARNFFTLRDEAGLSREWIAAWNIVPWYVSAADGSKIRAVTPDEVRAGLRELGGLVRLLPRLRAVVPMGGPARRGWALRDPGLAPGVATIETWHPSPLSLNPHPERRDEVREAMRQAARVAGA